MSDLATITDKIRTALGENSGLGKIVKVNFGSDGLILINAAIVPNQVTNSDGEADATINMAMDDFVAMAKGQLDPMMAFMSGKLKIEGDMMLAQKLAPLLRG